MAWYVDTNRQVTLLGLICENKQISNVYSSVHRNGQMSKLHGLVRQTSVGIAVVVMCYTPQRGAPEPTFRGVCVCVCCDNKINIM